MVEKTAQNAQTGQRDPTTRAGHLDFTANGPGERIVQNFESFYGPGSNNGLEIAKLEEKRRGFPELLAGGIANSLSGAAGKPEQFRNLSKELLEAYSLLGGDSAGWSQFRGALGGKLGKDWNVQGDDSSITLNPNGAKYGVKFTFPGTVLDLSADPAHPQQVELSHHLAKGEHVAAIKGHLRGDVIDIKTNELNPQEARAKNISPEAVIAGQGPKLIPPFILRKRFQDLSPWNYDAMQERLGDP